MAITDKEKGVWGLDQVYNKINQGSIWEYSGITKFFGWGNNNYGAGGQNGTAYSSPTQLPGDWSKIRSTGYGRQFGALRTDGTVWMWGRNHKGQLGQNNRTNYSSPIQIPGTTWGSEFAVGPATAQWIKTDGTLWAWGNNGYGYLGHNNKTEYSSPVQVGSDNTWSKVSASSGNTSAIKTDGTLWAWGYNAQGQLGQNNETQYSSPVQIGSDTTWSSISWASGNDTAFAIKTDGTLWSWGNAAGGVLGHNQSNYHPGVINNKSSPTQIPGTWSFMGTNGATTVFAVNTSGTLYAWGKGTSANIGDGEKVNRSSPVQIPGTTWSQVVGGQGSTVAVKTDGTLWTWGNNIYGTLGHNESGDGQPGSYSSPVQVGSDTGWEEPAASAYDVFVKRIL